MLISAVRHHWRHIGASEARLRVSLQVSSKFMLKAVFADPVIQISRIRIRFFSMDPDWYPDPGFAGSKKFKKFKAV
jgi:hypothetical protein